MKCTFVAIGAENISLEALSAMLKQHGHETELAYDQALFDDKNYLYMPRIASLFAHRDSVVDQVVASRPDLVGFSVLTPTLQWALDMARRIKQRLDVPVIFGGMHPTVTPEETIRYDCVDMICLGEGDHAIVELADAIEAGEPNTAIPNLWFKTPAGKIIRNEQRPLVEDLDTLPLPDKELFAPHVPIQNYYLAVTSRGCPYACTYCSLSFLAKEAARLKGKRLRERSPRSVVDELKIMRARYGFDWVDFRNNTFTANKKWVMEFCRLYKEELGLPFKVFAHPSTMDREMAFAMKDAGCFGIQLGVESFSERVRKDILNRHETNAELVRTVEAMDEAGLPYSVDYILGIPTQSEEELLAAAKFFIERKECYRVSPFLLEYLPRLEIVQHGLAHGEITEDDVRALENGEHNHYLSTGSMGKDPEKLRFFLGYRLLYRLIPFLPRSVNRWLLRHRVQRILPYLPADLIIRFLDVLMLFRRHDRDAFTYAKNYLWWLKSRLRRTHVEKDTEQADGPMGAPAPASA